MIVFVCVRWGGEGDVGEACTCHTAQLAVRGQHCSVGSENLNRLSGFCMANALPA